MRCKLGKEALLNHAFTKVLKLSLSVEFNLYVCATTLSYYIMTRNIVTAALVMEVSNFISLHPFSINSQIYCAGKCILIFTIGVT